jgi:tetratricopeptide (TPR) repeat protein
VKRPPVLLFALLLGGCAYYNGLYNAERLVKRAEKAEREGRSGEAGSHWGEAAVKAETVLARFPNSKWAERARFIDGLALQRGGNCQAAVVPLARVATDGRDPVLADQAAVLWSECLAQLGQAEAAGFAVERLIGSNDPAVRSEASWRAGVAYRRTGRADEAVALLKGSDLPQARGELAIALAEAGRISESLALTDSLVVELDTLTRWGELLGAIGREDIIDASTFLDRVASYLRPHPDTLARWLSEDGARWLRVDTAQATRRWEQAYAAGPITESGVGALIRLLRFRLAHSADPAILDTVVSAVAEIEPGAGGAAIRANQFGQAATAARRRLDSLDLRAPQGDMRGFLLAEELRDSLNAVLLSASLFERVASERPESPYASKALFAMAAADPAHRDSLMAMIVARHPADPYVIALTGGDTPLYRVLEDSLARFARAARTPPRQAPRPGARPPARPTNPTPAAPAP